MIRLRATGYGLPAALILFSGLACGYRRLDRQPHAQPWLRKGDTVRLAPFVNKTARLGLEDRLSKALEYRIVAASPWRLVPASEPARWVLQGTLEKVDFRPIGLTLGNPGDPRSAGNASRIEVVMVASVDLLDGQTGQVVLSRSGLTFTNQYRVDQNFASFDSRESEVLGGLADDFAESMLTQVLEGSE